MLGRPSSCRLVLVGEPGSDGICRPLCAAGGMCRLTLVEMGVRRVYAAELTFLSSSSSLSSICCCSPALLCVSKSLSRSIRWSCCRCVSRICSICCSMRFSRCSLSRTMCISMVVVSGGPSATFCCSSSFCPYVTLLSASANRYWRLHLYRRGSGRLGHGERSMERTCLLADRALLQSTTALSSQKPICNRAIVAPVTVRTYVHNRCNRYEK